MTAGYGNFEKWEQEIVEAPAGDQDLRKYFPAIPHLSRLADYVPEARDDKWRRLEARSMSSVAEPGSLVYAWSVQSYANLLSGEQRVASMNDSIDDINEYAARDVLGARANVRMHDGAFSASIGRYKVVDTTGDIVLTAYERGQSNSLQPSYHPETGQRLARGVLIPVVAIQGLMLISKK